MDVFDQATELERLDRESALVRARASMDRGGPEWIDGVACCRECGDPIPQKRKQQSLNHPLTHPRRRARARMAPGAD